MDKIITLAHGSGCRATRELIENIIKKYLGNPILNKLYDSAILDVPDERLAFTTDSYTVKPLFFPGGDIGKLTVYGTINDLAVMGAEPKFLSLCLIIEEGFKLSDLEKIIISLKSAKEEGKVEIVCGDIKVVEKGSCDGIYLNSSGIGIRKISNFPQPISIGDKILINGTIGDHEIAILLARGEFKLKAEVQSDCTPLWEIISKLISHCDGIRFMRDATRGGIGVILNEISSSYKLGIMLKEDSIPIREEVRAMAELLGYEPIYLANEGKFVTVIAHKEAEKALQILKENGFPQASIIGEVIKAEPIVVMETITGAHRVIDFPYGTQLPRIC